MRLEQIGQWLQVDVKGNCLITGFSVDSRMVQRGELFFALPGQQVDGHHYLSEVSSKGAVAAVVSSTYHGESFGLILLPVPDVLEALQTLAKYVIESKPNRIIVAITGSVGKTTTKEFTTTILSQKYRVRATPGNSNSQIGLPLAILNLLEPEDEVLVLEMGMTHPGNLSRLVKFYPPDIAVITKVALVHACNFESIEEITKAKGEILSHPRTKLGIISQDIPDFDAICHTGSCLKRSFSVTSSESDFYLEILPNGNMRIVSEGQVVILDPLSIPGEHNRHNFLAAVAIARSLNVSWEQIEKAIPLLQLPERRLEKIEKKGIVFINDSYNASLLSVKAALKSLPEPAHRKRKIAVLGEMLELGKFSAACHQEVGECALEIVDAVFCLGQECQPIVDLWKGHQRPAALFESRDDLVRALKKELQMGDVVLLKGSRGKQLWKVLEEI